MLLRILKKDMKRRKSVNIILFLFITIASVFLSSSINNILVVFSSVDYYMDYANVPDINLITAGDTEMTEIEEWIADEASDVKDHGNSRFLSFQGKNITIINGNESREFDSGGTTMYIGSLDIDYCKVYDESGKEFTLSNNEVALPGSLMERNDLHEGDEISIHLGEKEKTFTIAKKIKDAAYGREMVGMSRIIVNDLDFQQLNKETENNVIGLFFINSDNPTAFTKQLNEQGFLTLINTIARNTYTLVYSFDMIMAALLILVGICLILIALLVLRFTLVFTIEEDYREIGIMKAVGLRDFAIKKLYLTKYLVLVTAGSLLGLFISFPVSREMVKSVSANMIMKDTGTNFAVNVLCSLIIIFAVMLFCYHCTSKLNKISAIAAIRSGSTGESFRRKARFTLFKKKKMSVPVYLGLNDILGHVKRYLVLMITFCISFILITIPLNTVNTMKSAEMVSKFSLDPESSVYLRKIERPGDAPYNTTEKLTSALKRVEGEMQEKGYDASLTAINLFFFNFKEEGETAPNKLMTLQLLGPNTDYLTYMEGETPILENEIAFSKQVLNDNDWKIGDTVKATINGTEKSFLITGTYADYMQIGTSARINPQIDLSKESIFNCWSILVDMDSDKSQEVLSKELGQKFPEYEWSTAQDVVNGNVGGIQESLDSILYPMTGMLCAVIMLITLLMEKLFIVREKGEIAMMKSIGFKNRSIRLWQVLRMVWVALISMAAAVPLSMLSNHLMLKPIFAIMGADVNIQVDPLQVYGIYPGVLLLGIIAATCIASMKIKKINIRELNNLE